DLYFAPKGFKEPAKQTFSAVESFAAEIGHFAESLINGTRPVHSAEEDRDVLEVVLKAAESADGWQVCAAKKFQIKEEKPQEHHDEGRATLKKFVEDSVKDYPHRFGLKAASLEPNDKPDSRKLSYQSVDRFSAQTVAGLEIQWSIHNLKGT